MDRNKAGRIDKGIVSRFLENAQQIFEAAGSASQSGLAPSDISILIDGQGGVRMLADSDWPLASLEANYGCCMAYRVNQNAGRIRVEGRSGAQSCLLQTETPQVAVKRFLLDRPQYVIAPPQLSAANLPSLYSGSY